jgi:hypothetical protein
MSREQFIESDLDEGLGVEGKRSRDAKADGDKNADSPLAPKHRPAPDERDQERKGKKRKPFDRLTIKEEDDANIFR